MTLPEKLAKIEGNRLYLNNLVKVGDGFTSVHEPVAVDAPSSFVQKNATGETNDMDSLEGISRAACESARYFSDLLGNEE